MSSEESEENTTGNTAEVSDGYLIVASGHKALTRRATNSDNNDTDRKVPSEDEQSIPARKRRIASPTESELVRAEEGEVYLREVVQEMNQAWKQDKDLLEKFFSSRTPFQERIRNAKERNYNSRTKRWSRYPVFPTEFSSLCNWFRVLLNDILLFEADGIPSRRERGPPSQLKQRRYVFATYKEDYLKEVTPLPRVSSSLYLAGSGPEFVTANGKLRPQPSPTAGLSPIEVTIGDGTRKQRNRLAANAADIFEWQSNRRFVFALLLTEEYCTVYMFDRAGATYSKPFNFHEDPDLFCTVICLLGSSKVNDIGFDGSIFLDRTGLHQIRCRQAAGRRSFRNQHYTVQSTIFQSPVYVGRGTFCWLVRRVGDKKSLYVIKDAWIAQDLPGKESEGFLLKLANDKGVTLGIPLFQSSEDIRQGDDPDTILLNRKISNPSREYLKLDRVHTRVVMKAYGKTLDQFSSRKELILAFHDAVLAHRNLHQIAGILHRDISIRNILIDSHGVEGSRGILIDFDNAVRVVDESLYAKKSRVGTYRFMSLNLLSKDSAPKQQTYINDLESFYYVLCWIMWVYVEPGKKTSVTPYPASAWDEDMMVYTAKWAHLKRLTFEADPFQPYFGASLPAMAERLRILLRRFIILRASKGSEDSPLPPEPEQDYSEFLAEIKKGISELELEEAEHPA
ncbi:hypothetical protein M422DRAFT_33638 [Sphaerobolus stellatus SS14]|uniref:Protein kinase domain-containing protein n=1 Tax=Sphaerobolus stellatus (strain SS14) TaxID=990650 RepID=A0A0C9U3R7_SPHS4|nr:hypothetical protein M422DRAFT_33638 [Sphaerobolus stellatus SS14]